MIAVNIYYLQKNKEAILTRKNLNFRIFLKFFLNLSLSFELKSLHGGFILRFNFQIFLKKSLGPNE